MKATVTLSANAGVAIHIGGYRIWIDALHTNKQTGFSAVDIPLQKRMLRCDAFKRPDLILCTHCHPDHFSASLTEAAMGLWPKAKLMLPERHFADQELIGGAEYIHSSGDLTVRFIKLPHDAEQYRDCIHYGLMISVCGKTVLIPGDCKIAAAELELVTFGQKIDLALLNFPWLTLKRGQFFVDEVIKPANILLYHLPFAPDDICGYRDAAGKAVQGRKNTQLLCEPLQSIELEL